MLSRSSWEALARLGLDQGYAPGPGARLAPAALPEAVRPRELSREVALAAPQPAERTGPYPAPGAPGQ